MAESKPLIVIPARIGSTRLKDKPLREIGGVPLIVHVWRRAIEADIGWVQISTDSRLVADLFSDLNASVMVCDVPNEHCGSDRCAYTVVSGDLAKRYCTHVINLQGDLPFIDPQIIRDLWALRQKSDADVVTAQCHIENVHIGSLFYRKSHISHIGIYAFTRESLARFASFGPSKNEKQERLEGCRMVDNGMSVSAFNVSHMPLEINTESDLTHANLIASCLRRSEDTGTGAGWPESHPGPDDGGV